MMETIHFTHVHNFIYFLVNPIFTDFIEFPIIETTFSERTKILKNPQIFFLLGLVLLEPDMMPWKYLLIIMLIHAGCFQAK